MFSMVPNIVFAPNIRKMQNTDTGRKTQTQLITSFELGKKIGRFWLAENDGSNQFSSKRASLLNPSILDFF